MQAVGKLDPLGRELMRLRWLNDAQSFGPALQRLQPIARAALSADPRWHQLSNKQAKRLATKALRQWLVSVCPECQGRRFVRIPNTPTLSDDPCPVCYGSGCAVLDDVDETQRYQLHFLMILYNRVMDRASTKLAGLLEDSGLR